MNRSALSSRAGSRPLRVCHVAYAFYESDTRVRMYAEAQAARGDHVDVVSLRRNGQAENDLIEGVHVHRIQERVVNESGRAKYLLRILRFFAASSLFLVQRSRDASRRYDLLHVHSVPDFEVFAALVPKLRGAGIILDIHDLLPEFYAGKFGVSRSSAVFRALLLAEKVSASFADHVIIANHLWEETLTRRAVSREKCSTFLNYPAAHFFRRYPRRRNDGKIRLWDISSGEQVRSLELPEIAFSGLAFSPDGRWLAASGDDFINHVWEVASGNEILQLSGHTGYIWALAYSPDGRKIASVGLDQTLRLWETTSGEPLLVVDLPTTSSSLAFSPNGSQIVVAGDDNLARLYNATTGDLIRAFFGHRAVVISVAFSHSGQYILTGSDDKTARLWEIGTGAILNQFIGHQDSIYGVAFSSDDRYVLTAGYDRQAILWDRESGVIMQRFIGPQDSLYAAAISANDRWILTGSADSTARLWPSQIDSNPRAFRHRSPVLSISLNADGSRLGVGTTGGHAYLWDTATGRELYRLSGHQYPIESVALSPNGKYLATAGDDYTVRIWLTETGKQLRLYQDFSANNWAVRFSPDSKTLAIAGASGLSLWSTFGGPPLHQLNIDSVFYTVCFSPEGQYLLAGGTNGYFLYESKTGNLLRQIENENSETFFASAISPDGRYAVIGGSQLRLLKFPSLEVVKTLAGHTGAVLSAAFSPDSRLLLTSSADGTARLWEVDSGQPLRVISSLQALANSATFSPDGKQIYVGGADNVVWKWDVDYQDLMNYACAVIGRDLTPEERQKYAVPFPEPVCNAR